LRLYTMAAAAVDTGARRAGKTWCAFTRHLLEVEQCWLTPSNRHQTQAESARNETLETEI